MSEFLKNFRSAQNNRYSGRKNPYDGHYYGQDLRNGNERRSSHSGSSSNKKAPPPPKDDFVTGLEELIPALKVLLETLANNQEELFGLKQRNATNMEIMASAFAEIALALGGSMDTQLVVDSIPEKPKKKEPAEGITVADLEKEGMQSAAGQKREVIKLMKKLRKKGGTYKEIAGFLNEKGIPTFSNNGKWHAQTIHRLCSK